MKVAWASHSLSVAQRHQLILAHYVMEPIKCVEVIIMFSQLIRRLTNSAASYTYRLRLTIKEVCAFLRCFTHDATVWGRAGVCCHLSNGSSCIIVGYLRWVLVIRIGRIVWKYEMFIWRSLPLLRDTLIAKNYSEKSQRKRVLPYIVVEEFNVIGQVVYHMGAINDIACPLR